MRWSIRSTMLVIVLPLMVATLTMSAARISDLTAIRHDVEGLRHSAFRAIYAERYARHLHAFLKVSFDHLAGRGDGSEAIRSARARMDDTLERLRPFVHEETRDDATVSELTRTTLGEWENSQKQVDIYLERAAAFTRKGEPGRARRFVMDELEVLARSRIFSSIDRAVQREQELLEEHRVRVTDATDHWLARIAGVADLREGLLPDVYGAILAERFARNANAELKSFTYYVLEGRSHQESHGIAASQALARLNQLQPEEENGSGTDGVLGAAEPAATYARIRDAYARTQTLPLATRRSNGLSILGRLGEVFNETLLPHTDAIIAAHIQSIEREMAHLDLFALAVLLLTFGIAVIALLLGVGSPYMATRLMVRPVADLADTVSSFRAGNQDARPRLIPNNELGLLASSLGDLLNELQESDRKVRALAFYDSTTGLPNRQFFYERVAGALVTARLQERTMGLLTVSLTGLNQVNDTVGHSAGDDLILQLAERLRESVRLSDIVSRPGVDQNATEIAHLGGDQFTILLTKVHEASDAAIAAQRVLAKLAEPFVVEGREIVVTTSIGIGIYPQDGGDAGTLVRNSGAAMNEARGRGGNGYQFYSEAMNVANSRKLHIQSRLGGVIERDDLSLHYQPIRDAKNGHLTGAEALLRWTDSELGPIGPEEFIPIAEHGGLISAIGNWVLTTACEQVRAWQQAGYPQIRMSVNVSASQLSDSGWVEMVAETLRETQVSPGCLEFEITETTILQDEPRTIAAVTQIAKMGIGFALDDFGTGYSSLSHLRNLPVCRLKIDRSFVSEISESEQGAGLAGAIVTLAHGLQLEVVAEGVETQEQAQFLRSKGCDELQGYLISRAVPAAEFERFLAPRKPE